MRLSLKKITLTGIFASFSLIAFMIESLFPPIIIPGARLGVSNVFILLTAIIVGSPYAIVALVLKCLLGSVFSGNISSVIYSLPAGLLALTGELLLLKFCKGLSIVSISVFGGTFNLTLQNLVFCLITKSTEYLIYLPYLALIGFLAGLTVGLIVYFIIKYLPRDVIPYETEEQIEH